MSWKLNTTDQRKLRPIYRDIVDGSSGYPVVWGRMFMGFEPIRNEHGDMIPAMRWEDDDDGVDTPILVEANGNP